MRSPDEHRGGASLEYHLVAGGHHGLGIVLAHYLAVIPRELMYSFVAWATGIKSNPFDIHWGEASPGNVLLLYYIDEKVDYQGRVCGGQERVGGCGSDSRGRVPMPCSTRSLDG